MLKIPENQVAGHRALDGMLGPLIDDSGRFYKPLQKGERGSDEVAFYVSFYSNTKIPDNIRQYFPKFHGTQMVDASDGSGLHAHLVLQDLVSGRVNPSIMDIKIGARTWYPQASDKYIDKCLKKDKITASSRLGFRISGLQVYRNKELGFWKPEKRGVLSYTPKDIRLVLRKFVSSNIDTQIEADLDCLYATAVYGGSTGILSQLLDLKAWFEDQTIYHFNSCSILTMYDKEALLAGKKPNADIKLIDFTHVIDGEGVIDHNFLGGLCSLIKLISEILTNLNNNTK